MSLRVCEAGTDRGAWRYGFTRGTSLCCVQTDRQTDGQTVAEAAAWHWRRKEWSNAKTIPLRDGEMERTTDRQIERWGEREGKREREEEQGKEERKTVMHTDGNKHICSFFF